MPDRHDADRRRIARYLADHGPTPGDELAVAVGLPPTQFWDCVSRSGWFEIERGGWDITDRGRAEGLIDPASN